MSVENLFKPVSDLEKKAVHDMFMREYGENEPYPPNKQPMLLFNDKKCPDCNNDLIYTGRDKIMYPPLQVMNCNECKCSYWRSTVGDK